MRIRNFDLFNESDEFESPKIFKKKQDVNSNKDRKKVKKMRKERN